MPFHLLNIWFSNVVLGSPLPCLHPAAPWVSLCSASHSASHFLAPPTAEIMSYSRRPWPTSSKDDIARQCVRGQLELEKPKLCPMRLHRVIEKCCAMAPASRPKPVQVLAAIEDLLDELSTSPDSDALYLQEGIRLAPYVAFVRWWRGKEGGTRLSSRVTRTGLLSTTTHRSDKVTHPPPHPSPGAP